MPSATDDKLAIVEGLLARVNEGLKGLAGHAKASQSPLLQPLLELERLSRWRCTPLPQAETEAVQLAIARARAKASEYGEPVVVVRALGGEKLVVMTRARFVEERPFGAADDDVVHVAHPSDPPAAEPGGRADVPVGGQPPLPERGRAESCGRPVDRGPSVPPPTTYVVELRRRWRILVERDRAGAEETARNQATLEMARHGGKVEAAVLGERSEVERLDRHKSECEGCCPCCDGHCPFTDGVSCGARQ